MFLESKKPFGFASEKSFRDALITKFEHYRYTYDLALVKVPPSMYFDISGVLFDSLFAICNYMHLLKLAPSIPRIRTPRPRFVSRLEASKLERPSVVGRTIFDWPIRENK